jgi:hypothetical protein
MRDFIGMRSLLLEICCQNKNVKSMPWVRFEHTIPASERTKTVYALNRAITVIGAGY